MKERRGTKLLSLLLCAVLLLGLAPGVVIRAEAENTETIVWEGDQAISWDGNSYTGVQFDTYDLTAEAKAKYANLAQGYIIRVYTSNV